MNAVVVSAIVILVCLALVLLRGLQGPTVYDRILAVNMVGTKTVILLVLLGFVAAPDLGRRSGFLDIAMLYALINFITTVAVLKFVEFKRLS